MAVVGPPNLVEEAKANENQPIAVAPVAVAEKNQAKNA